MMVRALTISSLALVMAGCSVLPAAQEPQRQPAPTREIRSNRPPIAVSPMARVCLQQLGAKRARFTPLPDAYGEAGCSAVNAINLTAMPSDDGELFVTNLGVVYCPLADDFAAWARFGVDRAARQLLGSRLVRVETFGSYSCRNVAGSSRRSAHASAQAIDVSAFVLADGRRITVAGGWDAGGPQRAFLERIQQSACRRFGTVLGPNYNAAHRDHFHLEHGDGSFCR